jgi:nucleotide-binding universal stress UspA family protein
MRWAAAVLRLTVEESREGDEQPSAKELVMETEQEPKQVVIGYDFSPTAAVALERGIEVACRAPHHVLHIVAAVDDNHPLQRPENGKVDYHHADHVQQAVFEKVALAFNERHALGQVHFFVHARIGKAADEILDLAQQIGADLIIIGSHGHSGVSRILFGSVSEAVVRRAHCPVMVARPKTYPHVDLITVVEAAPDDPKHKQYIRPHRYSYEGSRILTRSNDWPLP